MRGKLSKAVIVILFIAFIIMSQDCIAIATEDSSSEKTGEIKFERLEGLQFSNGEKNYGALYGTEYSETDTSEWLTLQLQGRGLRIVNEQGDDVLLVDRFGGVYINGQLCSPNNADSDKIGTSSIGFMFFLLIISLILGCFNINNTKKKDS